MVPDDTPELIYYRAVEDLFSAFRGVPHILSSKDFQLLRAWWRDQVPLTAVRTGVAEVFARRRERGEKEPVVSLSYCRHAVENHAKRIAEMRIGSTDEIVDAPTITPESVRALAESLRSSATGIRSDRPRVAAVIDRISHEVDEAVDVDAHFLEQHLYALETSLLVDCFDALEDGDRRELEDRARADAEKVAATPEALDRTFHALRDRLLRDLLQLPRLEIDY
jgi:hypothetical protein